MTEQLKAKCELLLKNRELIAKKYIFDKDVMSVVAALIFTEADREADIEKLEECKALLHTHTGVFSKFRKNVELALMGRMALSADPEKYITDVTEVYKKINKGVNKEDNYMILAAMMLCEQGKQEKADGIYERYIGIMKRMEKEHPILTNSGDITYVMLLACTDREIDAIIADMEEGFEYLKKSCRIPAGKEAVQSLCEVLALTEGDMKQKCDRILKISSTFAERKVHFGDDSEFSALAPFADIDIEAELLVDEVLEAEALLSKTAAFNDNNLGRVYRIMFALILIADIYGKSSPAGDNTYMTTALGIIKAKQTAAMISTVINILPGVLQGLAGVATGTSSTDSETSGAGAVSANSAGTVSTNSARPES